MYTVIQAVHSPLYIVAKCHFFSVVTWKDIIKYLQKCEGCTHFCEILYISTDVNIILNNALLSAGADVRMVNMRELTTGVLHTKFWIVDKKHIYIGSANMDWRSLTQVGLFYFKDYGL